MLSPRTHSASIPHHKDQQHHAKHEHTPYGELVSEEQENQTGKLSHYQWSEWLRDIMENPSLATVYRPLRHDEDPRAPSTWQIFWDDEGLPFEGIFTAPAESTAKKMLGSHRGCVLPIQVDFAHEQVAVAFPLSFSGYEMCTLEDYLEFRKHHQISDLNAKPRNAWHHADEKDLKNYSVVIVLPPQTQLSCLVILRNANKWTSPRDPSEDA